MTLPLLTRCPIGTIILFAALFLCADFSQSFAMLASATAEEKADVQGDKAKDLDQEAEQKANELKVFLKKLRDNVINDKTLLDGTPEVFTPTLFPVPARLIKSADQVPVFDEAMKALAKHQSCIRDTNGLSTTWDFGNNWSVGPGASVQLLRYETKSGKAAINAVGLGLGLSARFFSDDNIDAAALVRRDKGGGEWETVRSIRRVHPDCRVSTFERTATKFDEGKYYARSAFSVGLFAFVSKEAEQDTVKVDPAFTVGFLQDLLTFGVGINTHGRNRGNAFLLIGFGSAFSLGD